MKRPKTPQRVELIELRTTYNDLAHRLRAELYDDRRHISEIRNMFKPVGNVTGRVCGVCGLNSEEREILESHYRSQIHSLTLVLGGLDADPS